MPQYHQCQQCSSNFELSDHDLIFYDKVGPTINDRRFPMALPKLCPDCRQQRRLAFRNERNLYNRTCNLCQKSIVTIYSPDKNLTVYCRDCWWGDKWDPLQYGRPFDFNRSFFEQFYELMQTVPRAAIVSYNCENCEYTNHQNDSRNCYLTFGSGGMEDCMYCNWCYDMRDYLDSSYCSKGQIGYMNVDCYDTYNTRFSQDCKQTTDCRYCYDCRGTQNCFGCVGLRQKQYYIYNVQYSKEQYENYVAQYDKPEYRLAIQAEVEKLKLQVPRLSNRITKSENCTGDDIENCKNSFNVFGVRDLFDCRYCYDVINAKDTYDANRTGDNELTYEICSGGYYKYSQFVYASGHVNFSSYVMECMYSNNLFGCLSVRNKAYVILNKQYTKEEYEALVPQIIEHMQRTGEWGEFFPITISPYGYNETLANEYYPLGETGALQRRFKWSSYVQPEPQPPSVMRASDLPTDPKQVPETILQNALLSELSGKVFKITKQELAFYKAHNISLPRMHPNERYAERLKNQIKRNLYQNNCRKCTKQLITPYAPNGPENVYCESCYLESVY